MPINYGAGVLKNITVKNSLVATNYTNVINYTQQVGSSSVYNKFCLPLDRNKILMFITGFQMAATLESDINNGPFNPIEFHANATPISTSQYSLSFNIKIKVSLSAMNMTIIIYD